MAEQQNQAFNLAVIIILINFFLVIGGVIPSTQTPIISKLLKNSDISPGLQGFNQQQFQNDTFLTNDANSSLLKPEGTTFLASQTSNLQSAPNIGAANDIFGLIWELLYYGTNAIVVVLGGMGLPAIIYVPLGLLCYITIIFGFYDYIIGFIIAIRGLIFR